MPYADGMAVDRLSVTVPAALGEALRALAHEIRMAALDGALAEADRRFGPISERRLAKAEAELVAAMRPRKPRKRR